MTIDRPAVLEQLEPRRLLAAGGIDPYFGVDGDLSFTGGRVLVMRDGRIVTVNRTFAYEDGKPQYALDINRYSADGSVDPGFHVNLRPTAASLITHEAGSRVAAALDANDRLFVTVEGRIYCILPNGRFDRTFGASGLINSPLAGKIDDIFVQRDGKIVVSGMQNASQIEFGSATDYPAAAVVRITAKGKRDASFGPKGVRHLTEFSQDVYGFYDRTVVKAQQDSAGRLVFHILDNTDTSDVLYRRWHNVQTFVRHHPDGAIDPSLAAVEGRTQFTDGFTAHTPEYGEPNFPDMYGGTASPGGFTLDSRDRLVILLNDVNPEDPARSGMMRVNSDGSIDTSFGGGDGLVDSFFADDRGITLGSVLALASGKLLISAHGLGPFESGTPEGLLIQLNPDGSLDSSFGTSGVLALGSTRQINDLRHNADGSILSSETDRVTGDFKPVLRRLWPHEGPLATLRARNIVSASSRSQFLDVTYRDDGSIDRSTLDNRDLRVTTGSGFVAYAKFDRVLATTNNDGRLTARYKLAAPGGSWDATDNGQYTVALVGAQVRDTDGHAALRRVLGRFQVSIGGSLVSQSMRGRAGFSSNQIIIDDDEQAALQELV